MKNKVMKPPFLVMESGISGASISAGTSLDSVVFAINSCC